MRVRTVATCAVLAAAAAAPTASAAPKQSAGCRMTDARGDAGPLGDPSVDIVGADIAWNTKEVVGVLRLAGPASASSPGTAVGRRWVFGVAANGVRVEFERQHTASGSRTVVTVGGTPVSHTFRVAGDTLVWKMKRPVALAKPRLVFGEGRAETFVSAVPADNATSDCRA